MRILLAATLLFPFGGLAQSQDFDGLYYPAIGSNWSCKQADIGIDGGAVAISKGVMFGVGNTCKMTDGEQNGDGESWNFRLICSGEGDAYEEDLRIKKSSIGVTLKLRGAEFDWISCDTPIHAVK